MRLRDPAQCLAPMLGGGTPDANLLPRRYVVQRVGGTLVLPRPMDGGQTWLDRHRPSTGHGMPMTNQPRDNYMPAEIDFAKGKSGRHHIPAVATVFLPELVDNEGRFLGPSVRARPSILFPDRRSCPHQTEKNPKSSLPKSQEVALSSRAEHAPSSLSLATSVAVGPYLGTNSEGTCFRSALHRMSSRLSYFWSNSDFQKFVRPRPMIRESSLDASPSSPAESRIAFAFSASHLR